MEITYEAYLKAKDNMEKTMESHYVLSSEHGLLCAQAREKVMIKI